MRQEELENMMGVNRDLDPNIKKSAIFMPKYSIICPMPIAFMSKKKKK